MNTHAEYHRHTHQPLHTMSSASPVSALAPSEVEAGRHLVLHGDPSITTGPPGAGQAGAGQAGAGQSVARTVTGRRLAWVRPTEIHAYAAEHLGRGIDLHAELARRARRTPGTLTRSVGRPAPTPDHVLTADRVPGSDSQAARTGPIATGASRDGVQL